MQILAFANGAGHLVQQSEAGELLLHPRLCLPALLQFALESLVCRL